MYRHLLVTVDGSPGGIDAIGHALELARAVGARVTFMLTGAAPDSRLSERGCRARCESGSRRAGKGCLMRSRGRPSGAGHPGAGHPGSATQRPVRWRPNSAAT